MRKVSRSALVTYSTAQMFALVDDVESYPEFLPWCAGTRVHHRDEGLVEATLELARGSIRKQFRTRNTSRPGERMDIALVSGSFRHLDGGWTFNRLGDLGCKITLDLEFEFKSRVVDKLFGSYFEEICNSLVDAFIRRADAVYGAKAGHAD